MKKILLIVLLPLWSFGQATDSLSNFYARNHQMSWEVKYTTGQVDHEKLKVQIISQLEENNGIEILNSINPDIVRGRMKGVIFRQRQALLQDVKTTTDAEFRIYLTNDGYEVKLTSISIFIQTGMIAGNQNYSFEKLNLKSNGTIIKGQKKSLGIWSDFYDGIFRLK